MISMEPSNTGKNRKRRVRTCGEVHHCKRQVTYVGEYVALHQQNESGNSITSGHFAEPLANFPIHTAKEIQKDGPKWEMYHRLGENGVFHFPSFFYKCTHPRCSMRVITEEDPFHPGLIIVTYVGWHDHSDRAPSSPPWEPVDIMTFDKYIESLNPNYGIFLTHPSKLNHEEEGGEGTIVDEKGRN